MDTTPNLNLPIPNADAVPPTNISGEFPRIALALIMLDLIVFTLQGVVAGKAETEHSHAISTISGLTEALASKMSVNATFSLDDLEDVLGAADAAVNYVLVKNVDGKWVPSTALAALGLHDHAVSEVVGLSEQLADILDDIALLGVNKADATATGVGLASRLRFLASGEALPNADVGPIWHADYASVMTWQSFTANGAAYTGYASVEIGSPRLEGQSTARAGWLKRNGASYSKTTYAALWNWALHNGRVVALGSWAAGAFVFADNGNGTFKVPDNRAEFERLWDDGRGVDSGRVLGSAQAGQVGSHTHTMPAGGSSAGQNNPGGWNGAGSVTVPANSAPSNSGENRPRNVALLGIIKF